MTDPRLTIRRSRMRRIFMWVMGGAIGILVLAGVCSLVRRPDTQPVAAPAAVPPNVTELTPPPAVNPSPVAAQPPVEPSSPPAQAAETQDPLASAPSKAPLSRTHRPKAAPRKTRNAAVGSHSP